MIGRSVKLQFTSSDASTAALMTIYDDNNAAVTLGANERLLVDTLTANLASAVLLVTVFGDDNADASVTAGERIAAFGPGANVFVAGEEGYTCKVGITPKVKASGAGQVDITGSARIVVGQGTTSRQTWLQNEQGR